MIVLRDFAGYSCPATSTIRTALDRLDRTPHLFQVVIRPDGTLLGTITDGDVRRAMIQGVGLDEPVTACLQSRPVVGHVRDGAANRERLGAVASTRRFLPIVDDDGRLIEILVRTDADAGIAHALVMAGGYGRRLGERTRETPKPLLPVGGRPILDRVIVALEDAGVRRVILSTHYLGDQIRRFVEERENRARMDFVEESEPLGTAGALGLLPDLGRDPLLVVNGDVLTRCDFAALHEFHGRHGLDGTIGVARFEVQVPYGVVRHDEDGLLLGIDEKPRISSFVAAGVYYLGPAFKALVPPGQPMDMPDLLVRAREIGLKVGLFPIHEYWTDVGRPSDLATADAWHRSGES